jgi:hypothetical protein
MDRSDELLLEELQASDLLETQRGLDWCDRELRAASWFDVRRRIQLLRLRRRWARRWRMATGRPAVSAPGLLGWRLLAAMALVAAVAVVIVRPGDDPVAAPPPPPAEEQTAPADADEPFPSDTAAKRRAVELDRTMRPCLSLESDQEKCASLASRYTSEAVRVNLNPGSVLEIAVRSASGNFFVVFRRQDHPEGVPVRTCQTSGFGGCHADGTW